MKLLLIFAAEVLFAVLLTSCGSKKAGNTNGGSSGGPTVPLPTVSIDSQLLEDITAANAANFMLSGTCSEEGQVVTVAVEDLNPETAPTCTDGAWMAEIDLTHLTGPSREVSITADHSIDNLNAPQATGTMFLPPRVSIASQLLEDIASFNSSAFRVRGACSEDNV